MNIKTKILLSAMIVSLSALFTTISNVFINEVIVVSATQKDNDSQMEGWVIADCVNIRKRPSIKSPAIEYLYFNEKISYNSYSKNWVKVFRKGKCVGYVNRKYIENNKPSYKIYNAPYTNGKKTFMPYAVYKNGRYMSVFSPSSKQYELQQCCYTGIYGIRQCKNRFCVALGSAFGLSIGQFFDLCLDNGEVIKCIMADQKADVHTDSSNIITVHNGCMSEFIIDNKKLNSLANRMGDVSYCTDLWNSRVVKVKVYEKYIEL